jgi:hypothetical protein
MATRRNLRSREQICGSSRTSCRPVTKGAGILIPRRWPSPKRMPLRRHFMVGCHNRPQTPCGRGPSAREAALRATSVVGGRAACAGAGLRAPRRLFQRCRATM